jgi:hypothetical protein
MDMAFPGISSFETDFERKEVPVKTRILLALASVLLSPTAFAGNRPANACQAAAVRDAALAVRVQFGAGRIVIDDIIVRPAQIIVALESQTAGDDTLDVAVPVRPRDPSDACIRGRAEITASDAS